LFRTNMSRKVMQVTQFSKTTWSKQWWSSRMVKEQINLTLFLRHGKRSTHVLSSEIFSSNLRNTIRHMYHYFQSSTYRHSLSLTFLFITCITTVWSHAKPNH
jgi:hypothetical protein